MLVTIIHPNLGIGGAERLVVDVAVAMKRNGHRVQFVTNYFDPKHAFMETTEFDIKVIDIFPRSFFGFGHALCAYVRMCIAALYICIFLKKSELIFSDSISSCLLIFRIFRLLGLFNAPTIFYCHFPDQLLTTRKRMIKKFYRVFIDWFETWTTAMADLICVNSEFTSKTVSETFPCIRARRIHVLYPTLNTKFFDSGRGAELNEIPKKARHIFVSINRYERKKNIGLALEAFSLLQGKIPRDDYRCCFLIIAGGYDIINDENIAHFVELRENAIALGLPREQYVFLKSPTDEEKLELLRRATAVLYTPSNEHFGIVPVEAMYMKCCVIAPNSGGPRETIIDGETGFLVEENPNSFAEKMAELVRDQGRAEAMGNAGRKRVESVFAMDNFVVQLESLIHEVLPNGYK
ncbi:alpha-1,3-mannosyltransferase [Loa loa]|uniref:Alpha-1,3/1,6-mannosyltransferase ALG2 n=1 Tax=Loa loa TaxID=7209 RepID=A0A1I7W1R2_LOALO|nr:alpha-1,3-mannosyltransferase [Loa loa]EFO27147.1 alpha-1,3-mannosyltransferase [Loa loa]